MEYCTCSYNFVCRGDDLVVPFRESKLTRLFQSYFVGKGGKEARQGKVTMFVNISNVASVFDETMHVLRFSALTSKVSLCMPCCPTKELCGASKIVRWGLESEGKIINTLFVLSR